MVDLTRNLLNGIGVPKSYHNYKAVNKKCVFVAVSKKGSMCIFEKQDDIDNMLFQVFGESNRPVHRTRAIQRTLNGKSLIGST